MSREIWRGMERRDVLPMDKRWKLRVVFPPPQKNVGFTYCLCPLVRARPDIVAMIANIPSTAGLP